MNDVFAPSTIQQGWFNDQTLSDRGRVGIEFLICDTSLVGGDFAPSFDEVPTIDGQGNAGDVIGKI